MSNLSNYPSGAPPPPPMTASNNYSPNYESTYLQPQTEGYNLQSQYNPSQYAYSTTLPLNTIVALPPIPPPSRLEEFGSVSQSRMNMDQSQNQASFANQGFGGASYSQGMTHSVFPLAQTGTYGNHQYQTPVEPMPSKGTPWWVWVLVCLVFILLIAGGAWYYFKHIKKAKVTTVETPVVKSNTPVVPGRQTVISTTTTIGSAAGKKQVQSMDQTHYRASHLRRLVV